MVGPVRAYVVRSPSVVEVRPSGGHSVCGGRRARRRRGRAALVGRPPCPVSVLAAVPRRPLPQRDGAELGAAGQRERGGEGHAQRAQAPTAERAGAELPTTE